MFLGDGDIVLEGEERVIYPEWFGIFNEANGNDGTIDLDSNIRRCGRCHGDSAAHLSWGAGKYFIRDYLIDASNMSMSGQGMDVTTLINAPVNNTSTRFGNLVGIYAPSAALSVALGNRDWTGDLDIQNCHISDMTIEWDDTATVSTDSSMNLLAVLGVNGASVKRVKGVISTANRAFYVGTNYANQDTRNVVFEECKSVDAMTGLFISEGFNINTGKALEGIISRNNEWNVRDVASNASGGPSCGIYLHGGEVLGNIVTGNIIIDGDIVNGGAVGIFSSGWGATTRFRNKVICRGVKLNDFKEQGILSYLQDADWDGVELSSSNVETVVVQAGGMVLYTGANGGALYNTIRNCKFKNVSGTGTIRGIHINSNAGLIHTIENNHFTYENGLSPQYDIFYSDAVGVRGDVRLVNNTFYDTGAARS